MRISDWSSDVCSSDLVLAVFHQLAGGGVVGVGRLRRVAAAAAHGKRLAAGQGQGENEGGGQSQNPAHRILLRLVRYGSSGSSRRRGQYAAGCGTRTTRSAEHTSELQSIMHIVYALS